MNGLKVGMAVVGLGASRYAYQNAKKEGLQEMKKADTLGKKDDVATSLHEKSSVAFKNAGIPGVSGLLLSLYSPCDPMYKRDADKVAFRRAACRVPGMALLALAFYMVCEGEGSKVVADKYEEMRSFFPITQIDPTKKN